MKLPRNSKRRRKKLTTRKSSSKRSSRLVKRRSSKRWSKRLATRRISRKCKRSWKIREKRLRKCVRSRINVLRSLSRRRSELSR